MNEITIKEILTRDIYTKKCFVGVFARDELPLINSYPCCFVFNTKPRNHFGEHWLAMYYDKNGYATFFDSYGMHPEFYKLEKYLKESSQDWTYNKKRLQGLSSYCGYYAILFLICKSRNETFKFFKYFDNNYYLNDKKILKFINEFV